MFIDMAFYIKFLQKYQFETSLQQICTFNIKIFFISFKVSELIKETIDNFILYNFNISTILLNFCFGFTRFQFQTGAKHHNRKITTTNLRHIIYTDQKRKNLIEIYYFIMFFLQKKNYTLALSLRRIINDVKNISMN